MHASFFRIVSYFFRFWNTIITESERRRCKINEDTLHLLSECAAGTDMAIRSLDDVLKNSPDGPLQRRLASSKRQHESLAAETKALLRAQGKEAKSADPAARAMSWMKTEAMLAMKPGDATTADLISTGCSMGIKSLARYCNQYPTASREAKDIAQSLIRLEDQLVKDMRPYL